MPPEQMLRRHGAFERLIRPDSIGCFVYKAAVVGHTFVRGGGGSDCQTRHILVMRSKGALLYGGRPIFLG